MAEPKWLKDMNPDEYLKEDFEAKGKSNKAEKVEKTKKTEEPDTTTGASQH